MRAQMPVIRLHWGAHCAISGKAYAGRAMKAVTSIRCQLGPMPPIRVHRAGCDHEQGADMSPRKFNEAIQKQRDDARKRDGLAIYWRSIFDGSLQAHYRVVTPLWQWEHREWNKS